jgi:hypothetical protein
MKRPAVSIKEAAGLIIYFICGCSRRFFAWLESTNEKTHLMDEVLVFDRNSSQSWPFFDQPR